MLKILFGTVVLMAIAGGVALQQGMKLLDAVDPNASPQLFEVARGEGFAHVARQLEAAGLVQNARAVAWYARFEGSDAKIKAGEYELSAAWSTRAILDRLKSGRVHTYPVVLPEGIRTSEVAARLEAAGLADAEALEALAENAEFARSLGVEAGRLEGYLYPETYKLPRGLEPERILGILFAEFEKAWAQVAPLAERRGLTRHQVVTLASIVEKETAAPEERPLIAAVFLNRMKRGMRLETDPTVIYGIPNFDGNLRRDHLQDSGNLYNTYKISGLPPGPIANPGLDSLRAVVQPAETEYLFFVSRNDGTHHFSKTYTEHTNAVNEFQKRSRSQ